MTKISSTFSPPTDSCLLPPTTTASTSNAPSTHSTHSPSTCMLMTGGTSPAPQSYAKSSRPSYSVDSTIAFNDKSTGICGVRLTKHANHSCTLDQGAHIIKFLHQSGMDLAPPALTPSAPNFFDPPSDLTPVDRTRFLCINGTLVFLLPYSEGGRPPMHPQLQPHAIGPHQTNPPTPIPQRLSRSETNLLI